VWIQASQTSSSLGVGWSPHTDIVIIVTLCHELMAPPALAHTLLWLLLGLLLACYLLTTITAVLAEWEGRRGAQLSQQLQVLPL
jgi:hypothetical protein